MRVRGILLEHLSREQPPVAASSLLAGLLPAAAIQHHPAVHYYTSLPFFPMTPLDFNHLLISPVV